MTTDADKIETSVGYIASVDKVSSVGGRENRTCYHVNHWESCRGVLLQTWPQGKGGKNKWVWHLLWSRLHDNSETLVLIDVAALLWKYLRGTVVGEVPLD